MSDHDALIHPGPGEWWWLSFCAPERPAGSQFLGVAIVQGVTLPAAIRRAWSLGLNPGGEVASVALTQMVPRARWRERLLTRAEADACGDDLVPVDEA